LGLYPHHLGMDNGGNRAATDRLDVALYDRIKEYQVYFAEAVRLFIFNELLIEGGFDPFVSPQLDSVSDRCLFKFREIDVDTQVKKETHAIQKATANVQEIGETRMDIGMHPDMDESNTIAGMQARMTPNQTVQTKTADGKPGAPKVVDTTPDVAKKADTQAPSKGGAPNKKNLRRGPGNVIRPANQKKRRNSPNIRRSDDLEPWLTELVELLDDELDY
jgi:hypothetical protein